MIGTVGSKTVHGINNIGRFGRFLWQSMTVSVRSSLGTGLYPLIWTQMNIIGVRSVPVVMITGAFVGMTLAVQAYDQLAGMGLEEHLGVLINISVVKELGPVLAAVMLAGRIGGANGTNRCGQEHGDRSDPIFSGATDSGVPAFDTIFNHLC